jgi:hypothetical protein
MASLPANMSIWKPSGTPLIGLPLRQSCMGVMSMLKRNITYHISEERVDRACYIMQTIGIGEVIKEVRCVQEDGRVSWQCLTNTGVILVLSEDKKICITLYIATQPKVSAMYQGKTPSWVFNMVRKNRKYAEEQNKVRY